jgi:hypothetical protein
VDEKEEAGDTEYPVSDPTAFGWHVSQLAMGTFDILFPGLGYTAQQLAKLAVPDPLEKRRIEFLNRLAAGLRALQEKVDGISPRSLADNEDFVSAVIETVPLAVKTHRERKKAAFANTILNTALGVSLDDAVRGRFLSCLDEFSVGHIDMLRLLADPMARDSVRGAYHSFYMGAPIDLYKSEIQDMGLSEDALSFIIHDLAQKEMIEGTLRVMMSKQGASQKMTTRLGDAFLRFIEEPKT